MKGAWGSFRSIAGSRILMMWVVDDEVNDDDHEDKARSEEVEPPTGRIAVARVTRMMVGLRWGAMMISSSWMVAGVDDRELLLIIFSLIVIVIVIFIFIFIVIVIWTGRD